MRRNQDWGEVVINYLGRRCVCCESVKELHVHHIVPLSRGGKNEMANLEVMCKRCHRLTHRLWAQNDPLTRKPHPNRCLACEIIFYTKTERKEPMCPRCVTFKKQRTK